MILLIELVNKNKIHNNLYTDHFNIMLIWNMAFIGNREAKDCAKISQQ